MQSSVLWRAHSSSNRRPPSFKTVSPLMGGQLVPEGILSMEPAWRNFFENVATVQFDHRVLAIATFLAITALFIASFRTSLSRQVRGGIHMLLFTAAVQVALGIATLLNHVPVWLGATHQGVALLVLTAAVYVIHRTGHSRR